MVVVMCDEGEYVKSKSYLCILCVTSFGSPTCSLLRDSTKNESSRRVMQPTIEGATDSTAPEFLYDSR